MKKLLGLTFIFLLFTTLAYADFAVPTAAYTSDANTLLLAHMDGSDGSTTFPDSGNTNHGNATVVATAEVDTAQFKFSQSGLFDGDSGYIYWGDHADWAHGTDPFTIECWLRFDTTSGTQRICGQYAGAGDWSRFEVSSTRITLTLADTSLIRLDMYGSWSPSSATWYHIVFQRINTDDADTAWRIYVDGTSLSLTKSNGAWTASVADLASDFNVGDNGQADGWVDGWIDELRVSDVVRTWPDVEIGQFIMITWKQKIMIKKWWKNFLWKFKG